MSLSEVLTESRGCFWALIQFCPCDYRGDRFTIGAVIFDPIAAMFEARVSDQVAKLNQILAAAEYPECSSEDFLSIWDSGLEALGRKLGKKFDRTSIEVACDYASSTTKIRVTPPLGLLVEAGSSIASRLDEVFRRSVAPKLAGPTKRTEARRKRAAKPEFTSAR